MPAVEAPVGHAVGSGSVGFVPTGLAAEAASFVPAAAAAAAEPASQKS